MFPSLTIGGRENTGPVVIDLISLKIPSENRPVLDNHDSSTDGLIGRTVSVKKTGNQIEVAGFIYPKNVRAQKILSANDAGKSWQLSIGADNFVAQQVPTGQTVLVNGQTFDGPLTVIYNAWLTDISFVDEGGDNSTWATIQARRKEADRLNGGFLSPSDLGKRIAAAFIREQRRINFICQNSDGNKELEDVAIERGWTFESFDMKAMAYRLTGR